MTMRPWPDQHSVCRHPGDRYSFSQDEMADYLGEGALLPEDSETWFNLESSRLCTSKRFQVRPYQPTPLKSPFCRSRTAPA